MEGKSVMEDESHAVIYKVSHNAVAMYPEILLLLPRVSNILEYMFATHPELFRIQGKRQNVFFNIWLFRLSSLVVMN